MQYILTGFDLLAANRGITSTPGRYIFAMVLVVMGVIIIVDMVRAVFNKDKRRNMIAEIIAHSAALWAIVEWTPKIEVWFVRIADRLGIVSDGGRTVFGAALAIIGLALIVLFIKFGFRKVSEYIISSPQPEVESTGKPEEKADDISKVDFKKFKSKLNEMRLWVFMRTELSHTIYIREGHDTLYFKWLSKILTERDFKGELTGSVEGRINMGNTKVFIVRSREIDAIQEKILVRVILHSAYLWVNFDIGDLTTKINTAGMYEIKVEFASTKWRVLRGANNKLIGTAHDKTDATPATQVQSGK